MTKKQIAILVLILAVAAFFRYHLIHTMPGGLFPDEAAEGLDAKNIMHGFLQPFYERGNGREGLFYYLLVPFIKFFGAGASWPLHAAAATIGLLSVFTTYLMVKRLFDVKTALLSAFLMAVGTWDIVLSRTAFRANLVPLFTTITVYFIARTLQAKSDRERFWSALFGGAFLAGGVYTYIPFRMLIGILLFIAVLMLIADSRQKFAWFKQYRRSLGVGLIAFIIVIAPLGYYFVKHPGSITGRASQVSIFNQDLNHGHLLLTFEQVTYKSIRAFFTQGDLNWRQNISGQPFLSPLISVFFGLTLLAFTLYTLKFIWQCLAGKPNTADLSKVLMTGLFWGMLVPEILTNEGIPHGLRSIGIVPAAYALSAIGLVYFAHLVLRVWHRQWMEKVYWLVAILFFATLTFTSYEQYFVYARNSSDNYYAFRSDLTKVSDYLNQNPDKEHTYLVLDGFSVQTVDYLTAERNHPYVVVDPANSDRLHLRKGDTVIFTNSTIADFLRFRDNHKFTVAILNNDLGSTDMIVAKITANDKSTSVAFNPDKTFWALNLGNRVDWYWQNQSFQSWKIKIWQCSDAKCGNTTLVKENNQNDYFQNSDYVLMDGTKKDLYFTAQGFNAAGKIIKDFGIIKLEKYK